MWDQYGGQQQQVSGQATGGGGGGAGAPYAGITDSQKTTLWMGDLEPWMDENYIRKLWMSMGEAVNVKMIRDKITGNVAGIQAELGFRGRIGGHEVRLDFVKLECCEMDIEALISTSGGIGGGGPEYSIFVGDLGSEVTDVMLLQAFQVRYMTCKSAKVVTDPATGQSRGYGFVRFSDETEQTRAQSEMQGQFCGSRAMRISMATPKNNLVTPGMGSGMTAGQMMSGPPVDIQQGMAMPQYYPPVQPMMQQGMPPPHLQTAMPPRPTQAPLSAGYDQFNDPTNTTVFVGGLNTQITDEELRSYFSPFGEITYTKIPPGKACGFVQFVHRHSAELAITQMNGFMIANSRVRLSWGRSQAIPKQEGYRPASTAPVPPYSGAYGYPSHLLPQPPMVIPAKMPEDPLAPRSVDSMNAEYLRRQEEASSAGSLGGAWRGRIIA
ncbi:hypothetical protein HKX48_008816 [Thoreauomyces humboldtii]|nr:hypothetical protein HKX48_008816 [Thoreauomyces humboldtii]